MVKNIVIAAGGTGGHIFPGLAIAEELVVNGYKVVWIGTRAGLEANLIPKHNIDIHYINIAGIRGKNWIDKILATFNIVFAVFQSLVILHKLNPDTILGMGGFVTGPVGIAAWLLRKKLVIHEQNAIAGTTNKILLYFADHVLESFPNSFSSNHAGKIILTGLPVRKNLLDFSSQQKVGNQQERIFRILVLGGSRGAKFLNQIIPDALGTIANIKILHQTGEQDFQSTYDIYVNKNIHVIHEIKPFIENMLDAYSNVDLVICRSGAATIFEIMAIGLASILVPLPWAIDDHQTKNALYLADHNAAILVKQSDLTVEKIRNLVVELISEPNRLHDIRLAAKSLYKPYELNNSTHHISKIIGDLV